MDTPNIHTLKIERIDDGISDLLRRKVLLDDFSIRAQEMTLTHRVGRVPQLTINAMVEVEDFESPVIVRYGNLEAIASTISDEQFYALVRMWCNKRGVDPCDIGDYFDGNAKYRD